MTAPGQGSGQQTINLGSRCRNPDNPLLDQCRTLPCLQPTPRRGRHPRLCLRDQDILAGGRRLAGIHEKLRDGRRNSIPACTASDLAGMGGATPERVKKATAAMLRKWNAALEALRQAVRPRMWFALSFPMASNSRRASSSTFLRLICPPGSRNGCAAPTGGPSAPARQRPRNVGRLRFKCLPASSLDAAARSDGDLKMKYILKGRVATMDAAHGAPLRCGLHRWSEHCRGAGGCRTAAARV